MSSNPAYANDNDDFGETEKCDKFWTNDINTERAFGYAEAIDLTGNGWYNFGLLMTLSLALLAMALDMFSFAVVVTLAECDLELDDFRRNVLVTMPFFGPIFMAYFWGYICDTRGRKNSLFVALAVAYVTSTVGAFSSHWAMLALCRLISTCFCSCAQSATYTLIGESCPERVKGVYMLIMASSIHLNLSIYYPLTYLITSFEYSCQLGAISLVPWRVLVLILALPLGVSAFCLLFFYESPKFLLNAGHKELALEVLKNIYRRNGGEVDKYPVKHLILLEKGNVQLDETSLLKSMWERTVPLFKSPSLLKTMLLYFLIFAIYSASSALLVWLPFLADSFSEGVSSANVLKNKGLCHMIHESVIVVNDTQISSNVTGSHGSITENDNNVTTIAVESCSTKPVGLPIVMAAVAAGCTYSILNALISKLAARKRIVMLCVFLISGLCGIFSVTINSNITSIFMYFGILLNCLNMGTAFSYCVDLYPTSFRYCASVSVMRRMEMKDKTKRGMAACLGVLVARVSGIAGVNLVGPFIKSQCGFTFYGISILMFGAAAMSYFLPPDNPNKK